MPYRNLTVVQEGAPFRVVEPPYNMNHPQISRYPQEVSGYYLLESLRRRLGWNSFDGRRLLDVGCGVRFARTIFNLNLPFALYAGVDVNAEVIAWLQGNLPEPAFRFAHLDARNALYNPEGNGKAPIEALANLGLTGCEAACMFSVITHQSTEEARVTFAQIRHAIPDNGQLYFTAFADESVDRYAEKTPTPGVISAYHPAFLVELVESCGWRVDAIYAKDDMQQTAFACRAV